MKREAGRKLFLGCSGTLLAAVLMVSAAVLHLFRSCEPPEPPDVAAVARSEKVAAAGRRAATTLDGLVAWLGEKRRGLDRHPSVAVLDRCESNRASGLFADDGWSPVACTRRVRVFAGFGGDFADHGRRLHRELLARGWAAYDAIPEATGGYRFPQRRERATAPPDTDGASGLPSARYVTPKPSGAESWSEQPLTMVIQWEEKGVPKRDGAYAIRRIHPPSDPEAVREERRVEARLTLDALHRAHRYAVVIDLEYRYFDAGT